MRNPVVVAVVPHWHLDHSLASSVLLGEAAAVAAELRALVDAAGGEWVEGDGESLTALFEAPGPAWDVALGMPLHRAHAGVSVALGCGEVAVGHSGRVFGDEVSRARRLAWYAPGCSVHCTQAFLDTAAVPPGIGVHRVPPELERRCGFQAHQVADYR